MVQPCYKISAPGSLMLMGEHAVLHGKTAIVCAINKRITVTLTPHTADHITIKSTIGEYRATKNTLNITKPFEFVLQAIRHYQLPSGFDLLIESEFSPTLGLGSSAAVTVATIAAFNKWLQQPEDLLAQAIKVIHQIQKRGSGADVAASIFGGTLLYRIDHPVEICPHNPPLIALYSGYKTPTAVVIAEVESLRLKYPTLINAVFDLMDHCSQKAAATIRDAHWQQLGEIVNIAQGLMDAIGVNSAKLAELIAQLRTEKTIYGAKISGSGLGDCVIGIGHLTALTPLDITISKDGLRYESA